MVCSESFFSRTCWCMADSLNNTMSTPSCLGVNSLSILHFLIIFTSYILLLLSDCTHHSATLYLEWHLGFVFGELKKKIDFQVSYSIQRLKKNKTTTLFLFPNAKKNLNFKSIYMQIVHWHLWNKKVNKCLFYCCLSDESIEINSLTWLLCNEGLLSDTNFPIFLNVMPMNSEKWVASLEV